MKYGILTFHETGNFGATLQAYALCKKMRDMGVDCEIIDYRCANIYLRESKVKIQGKNLIRNLSKYLLLKPIKKKKLQKQRVFLQKNNMLSEKQYVQDSIKNVNDVYDAFIVGSDQVWNFQITNYDMTYLLDFVNDEKYRYAYASSSGCVWSESDLEKAVDKLLKFNLLSVREQDTYEFINKNTGILSRCVCDPTMLLTGQEWEELLCTPKREKYILIYYPNTKLLSAAKLYAKQSGKKIVVINTSKPIKGVLNEKAVEVQEFLTLIYHADMVFTDSFHGVAFCLYFHKKFWVSKKSNRIQCVLNRLGIKDRYLDSSVDLEKNILYTEVDLEIQKYREDSLQFLNEVINRI